MDWNSLNRTVWTLTTGITHTDCFGSKIQAYYTVDGAGLKVAGRLEYHSLHIINDILRRLIGFSIVI